MLNYDELGRIGGDCNYSLYRINNIPSIIILVNEDGIIVDAIIDQEYNYEIHYELYHWWSDWCGDETGYDDVSIVGLYAVKAFPMIEMYIDVENEMILEVWVIEEEILSE